MRQMVMTTDNKWVLALAAVAIALVNTALFSVYLAPDGNEVLTTLFDVSLFAGLALLFVLAIIALVLHNSSARCNPVCERQVMLIIKLGLVPFYLFGGMLIFVLMVIPATALMTPLLAAAGWLVMLTGSVWAICYALSMRKAGMISGGVAALFIVMQFFFVLDVVAALVMFFLGRSREKAAEAGA